MSIILLPKLFSQCTHLYLTIVDLLLVFESSCQQRVGASVHIFGWVFLAARPVVRPSDLPDLPRLKLSHGHPSKGNPLHREIEVFVVEDAMPKKKLLLLLLSWQLQQKTIIMLFSQGQSCITETAATTTACAQKTKSGQGQNSHYIWGGVMEAARADVGEKSATDVALNS